MGRDSSDLSIDSHIADAIRHAILIYGESVLYDPGLMEILRDHGAFRGHTYADDIIHILIDNGQLPYLYTLSNKENNEVIVGVEREVCKLSYLCSIYENEIRKVLHSILKGMNMSLDIQLVALNRSDDFKSFMRPEYDISDNSEIDTDDNIVPPSFPILSRKKPKGNQEVETAMKFTQVNTPVKKDKRIKRLILVYVCAFMFALVISAGVFVFFDKEKGQLKDTPSTESETYADRMYREVLEDIQSHNGQISPAGREKLDRALKDYPNDYWFNFIKEKTK